MSGTQADEEQVAYYSTAKIVTRAAGDDAASADGLLEIIKKKAPDPSIFEEEGVRPFTWAAEVSSTRIDSYFTRQDIKSLKNYVKDANDGVMFLDSHDKRQLGFGQSVRGTFTAAASGNPDERVPADNDPATVVVDFFTIPGVQLGRASSDSFIASVRSGVLKDVSIGFMPDRFECNLCKNDPFDWWSMDCMHIPGAYYDSTGKNIVTKKSEGALLAFAWVRDSRLLEVSAVYDGAAPGAYIKKAQWLADAGEVNRAQATILERQLRIRLPERAMSVPVLKIQDGKMMLDRGAEVIIDGVQYTEGMEIMPKTFRKLSRGQDDAPGTEASAAAEQEEPAVVVPVSPPPANDNLKREESPEGVAATSGGITSPAHAAPEDVRMNEEQIRQLEESARRDADVVSRTRRALAAAGVTDAETVDPAEAVTQLHGKITTLEPRAEVGDKWRTRVVNDALDAGVRAEGNDFDRAGYEETFAAMTIEQIERLAAVWEKQAPAVGSGRRTADIRTDPPKGGDPAKQSSGVFPAEQYSVNGRR